MWRVNCWEEEGLHICGFLSVCGLTGRPGVRRLATFSEEKVAEETHAKSTMTTWKRIVGHMLP